MVFNDTTNGQGLIQDCEDLCKLGSTAISGNATLLKTFTRYINSWYAKSVAWIIEAQGTWEFDDPNRTDMPIATTDLTNAQQDYTLPPATTGANVASMLKLQRLEVMDSNGDYQKLTEVDETQIPIAMSEFESVDGLPKYYRLVGGTVELYPAPATGSVTMTDGLKCYFQRSPDAFTSSDTTQQPGFPDIFHRLLSLGASYDYTFDKNMRQEIEQLRTQMQEFYAQRNRDTKIRIMPRMETYK